MKKIYIYILYFISLQFHQIYIVDCNLDIHEQLVCLFLFNDGISIMRFLPGRSYILQILESNKTSVLTDFQTFQTLRKYTATYILLQAKLCSCISTFCL